MKNYFFTFILLSCLIYAQTDQQKDRAYKNFESKCNSTILKGLSKPQWVDKETYLAEAKFYPVYFIDYNSQTNKQDWKIDPDKFLVVYKDNLSSYIDLGISEYSNVSNMYGQNKFANRLLELYKTPFIDFKIGYLTDLYYPSIGTLPNLLLSESNKFIDKEHLHQSINDVISSHYSSITQYEAEKQSNNLRRNLSADKIIQGIKAYFRSYEYYCPKDTSLVLSKFIENLEIGTGGITEKQKTLILDKLNSEIRKKAAIKSQNTQMDLGDFSIYNVNYYVIANKILKPQQISNYGQYMDIHFPRYLHKQYGRYIYGEINLIHSKIVKGFDNNKETEKLPYFKEFVLKQYKDCGCNIENKAIQIKI